MEESKHERMVSTVNLKKLKENFSKDELVQYIAELREEKAANDSFKLITKRVEFLEKSQLIAAQYTRRESIEISGIPETITDKNLGSKCVDILDVIGCDKIQSWQIHACHRLKNRRDTICRFVTRKFADSALHNRKHLKNLPLQELGIPDNNKIFINESLCPQLKFLHYKVRHVLKSKTIFSFNLWKGKLTIKLHEHAQDIYIYAILTN